MKYLKSYENIRKLKVGDYLLVKTTDGRINNEVAIVTKNNLQNDFFIVELPDYVGEYSIYRSEIIRRLTKEEAEIYKNIEKYNI